MCCLTTFLKKTNDQEENENTPLIIKFLALKITSLKLSGGIPKTEYFQSTLATNKKERIALSIAPIDIPKKIILNILFKACIIFAFDGIKIDSLFKTLIIYRAAGKADNANNAFINRSVCMSKITVPSAVVIGYFVLSLKISNNWFVMVVSSFSVAFVLALIVSCNLVFTSVFFSNA